MKDMKLNCKNACDRLEIEALESRRETLSHNFALKLLDSPHNKDFFTFTEKTKIFLRRQPILKVTINHDERCKKSPLPLPTSSVDSFLLLISKMDIDNHHIVLPFEITNGVEMLGIPSGYL